MGAVRLAAEAPGDKSGIVMQTLFNQRGFNSRRKFYESKNDLKAG